MLTVCTVGLHALCTYGPYACSGAYAHMDAQTCEQSHIQADRSDAVEGKKEAPRPSAPV